MEKCPECSGRVTSRMKKCPECGVVFKKCPRCKEMVTESDKKCSGCGASLGLLGDLTGNKTEKEQKEFEDKTKEWIKNNPVAFAAILLGFLVIGLIAALTQDSKRKDDWKWPSTEKKQEKTKSPEEIRRERIEKHFSAWDGSHIGLTRLIKESMHDSDSYSHVKTVYVDRGSYLLVTTTFRGKNGFGAVRKNSIKAKVDLDGKVIQVIAQGP